MFYKNKHNTRTKKLTGMRFGLLFVEDFAGYFGKKFRHACWECLCDCGETRIVKGTRLTNGNIRMCAQCAKKAGAKKQSKSLRLDGDIAAFNRLCGWYRANAKKRGLPFGLNPDELRNLFTSDCYFCGQPPNNRVYAKGGHSHFVYNGIDRLDNDGGYTPQNSIPCCSQCNFAKRDFSAEAFLCWVERIWKHQKKK